MQLNSSAPLRLLLFLAVICYLSAGVLRVLDTEASVMLVGLAALTCLAVINTAASQSRHIILFCLGIALAGYTYLFSTYIGRSAIVAFFFLSSIILFIALDTNDDLQASENADGSVINIAKWAFLVAGMVHALTLIFLYIIEPVRVSGLMEDYSQASLFILLAFGMAYPLIKDKSYFTAITLVLFVGFFTTFSRSANFLLLIFLLCLFLHENKYGSIRSVVKAACLVLLALAFVYIYPAIVDLPTVDRGGVAHFSTLNSRTVYWQAAWEAILQQPWMGYGLGNYEWTGIKNAKPFTVIHHVHNDYLQLWHDLGLFWVAALVFFFLRTLIRYSPWGFTLRPFPMPVLINEHLQNYVAWTLLACIAMYMMINFAISGLVFQVGIAILFADLLRTK
ncbi:MAG: O-antigen ligase family protein [Pseudomonadota bacterium]